MNAHNTTMAKALKSMREQQASPSEIEQLKAELLSMNQQLNAAIQRGNEIQAEKDEALALASESVGEVDRYRGRLVESQARAAKKIISHWKSQHLHSAWSTWVQAYETAKTDKVLADTIGGTEDDEIAKLLNGNF